MERLVRDWDWDRDWDRVTETGLGLGELGSVHPFNHLASVRAAT